MKIPLVDLNAQYMRLNIKLNAAVIGTMERGDFILGEAVSSFESDFSAYCHSDHAIGVASGLDALTLTLVALGVKGGDEVITVANTFVATTLAIVRAGAEPVLVDCSPATYNIDPLGIEEKITEKTRVIMPVHLYGRPADMDPILELASRYNLKVVEDACQSHGALYRKNPCGSMGDAGCFSFYPGKNLGAYGDGGCVVTGDEDLAEKIRLLRNYGSRKKYYHEEKGVNSRLDTIQAAVLNVKLPHLEDWNKKRRQAAKLYTDRLEAIPSITTPLYDDGIIHVFHLYVIRVPNRDQVLKDLNSKGIGAGIHYPIPIHQLKCHSDLGYREGDFPITERYSREILSLPIFPEITEEQIDYVVEVLKTAVSLKT